jgi:ectoine hydroxylase-related dioxygenase (phytanoyl-CoA dioxygenase family)
LTALTSEQIQHFYTEGYVVVENAVEPDMLRPLREAAARVVAKTRSGAWPYKRDAGDGDIWGVSHLLHPDLGEPIFAEYVASPPVLEVVGDLLGPDLKLELVNMLVNPAKHDYEIGWHRDLVRADLPPDEEVAMLKDMGQGVQWNTALYDEACLMIVPASHLRAKTPEERDVCFNRPKDSMPHQMAVSLQAGQGVYYNANLLHRGVYSCRQQRETIHACMESVHASVRKIDALAWMKTPGFRESLPPNLVPLYDNWRTFEG